MHATAWCGRHYEAEKMMFPLKYDFPDLQDGQKSGGPFIEILVNMDVVLRFLTFPYLILAVFCSVLGF